MSLRATMTAIQLLKSTSGKDSIANDLALLAEKEIAALREAATALDGAGWLTIIPEERGRTSGEADAAQLLATIAKEAE